MMKIISQTKNGRVFKCPNCVCIHFEYKNLNINFDNYSDYRFTAEYFLKLDGRSWEERNKNSYFKRKIFVPIGQKNFNILLNSSELLELKSLFSRENHEKFVIIKSGSDINFSNN